MPKHKLLIPDLSLKTLNHGGLKFQAASAIGAVWGDDEGYTVTLLYGDKWPITDKAGESYAGRGARPLVRAATLFILETKPPGRIKD
jgi:hypothetical protein